MIFPQKMQILSCDLLYLYVMKRFLPVIILLLAAVGCVREWSPASPEDGSGLVERTWTVTLASPSSPAPTGDPATRATLDDALFPVWEVGENLSVYDPVQQVGRVFKVTAVNGRTATISGTISEGDFPFDAIYPSKSAGAWSTDGTNRAKLPAVQVIPAGRSVCPDVLVSTAHSEHPEEGVTFHNAVSLLKFTVAREDIASVRFELSGTEAATWTTTAKEGTFAPGEYYLAVYPGAYEGITVTCDTGFGQEFTKSSSKPLTTQLGGLLNLGTVSDGKARYAYAVTSERTYADLSAMIDETGILDGLATGVRIVINAMLRSKTYFSISDEKVRAFNITYPSVDPQGLPVTLSARVYVREKALGGGKRLDGIAIASHSTIACNNQCPTLSVNFEAMMAWKNYAIVMPDYYGFGASSDRPQAFLDWETTARGNVDAYRAACQLMEDRSVKAGDLRFNYGYSQGGFNAMATLRYVSVHPDLELRFTKTFAGGGPYDVRQTWESYLTGNFGDAIGFIPLTLVSMNESQQLGIDYAALFKEPLLSNWQDWILSKKYTMNLINGHIGDRTIADILTEDMVAGRGPASATVMQTCDRYSLNAGWKPVAGSRIYLYHSNEDNLVPYVNYTRMMTYLESAAPDCELHGSTLSGDHQGACVPFILDVVNQWKAE